MSASSVFIVMLDTSPNEHSRSRAGLHIAAETARKLGAEVRVLKAAHWPLCPAENEETIEAARLVAASDAVLVAGPVFDWSPAPQTQNAVVAVLDKTPPRFRPWALLAGSGGKSAFLSFDSLSRCISAEVEATMVGRPLVLAGADADPETGEVQAEAAERIRETVGALVMFARTFHDSRHAARVEGKAE